jgi:hypothetical protein
VFLLHKNSSLAFSPVGRKSEDMEKVKKNFKGGRPAKIIKRDILIGVRFNKPEHFIVRHKSSKAGLSYSRYLREMGIKGEVKARLSEEDSHDVRKLIGMSNNLNQLTKLAHQEGLLKALLYFENYRNQFDELLKRLNRDK